MPQSPHRVAVLPDDVRQHLGLKLIPGSLDARSAHVAEYLLRPSGKKAGKIYRPPPGRENIKLREIILG